MPRKNKRAKPILQPLEQPNEMQMANGHFQREDMIHAESGQRVTAWKNCGGTPVMRWWNAGRLDRRQLMVIEWCQSLWRLAGAQQRVTSTYGERIAPTHVVELAAVKVLAADKDLRRFQSYVSERAWSVFENVCRFNMAAGVAGSELGYGSRSAEVRAHTLVCEVADMIAEREKI